MNIFQKEKLDNGLEIIAEVNEDAYSMALGFFVRTGSRDESEEIAGVSHFLEHMLFKGTNRRSAEDVNRELDEMGGNSNAFTSEEMTVYYSSFLPELQSRAVDLLSDFMRPALRKEDFETEKSVILEEISMYFDQPPYAMDEKSRELFFKNHPLERSVLGTIQSIGDLSVEQMRTYFERQYSPGNMTVVACGCVDFDLLVKEIQEKCGHWQPFAIQRETFRPQSQRGFHLEVRETTTQEYVFQLTDGPSVADPDRYAVALLANIIGDDVGSRLFWELVDNGKADSATLSSCEFLDTGMLFTALCCMPDDVEQNMKLMRQILNDVEKNGVTEEELSRAKNKILSRIVLASERPRGRLFSVGSEWTQTKKYSPIENDMKIVRDLTLDEVNAALKTYPLSNPLTVAVGPLKELKDRSF